jgi:hypothetical protein
MLSAVAAYEPGASNLSVWCQLAAIASRTGQHAEALSHVRAANRLLDKKPKGDPRVAGWKAHLRLTSAEALLGQNNLVKAVAFLQVTCVFGIDVHRMSV